MRILTNTIAMPAISPADAIEEIFRNAGTQFDPAVVSAFERCMQRVT